MSLRGIILWIEIWFQQLPYLRRNFHFLFIGILPQYKLTIGFFQIFSLLGLILFYFFQTMY